MLKDLFTINKALVASISAVGYGAGYKIPAILDYDPLYCIIISMLLGTGMDVLGRYLVYSSIIHNHHLKKALITAIIIFFIFCDTLSETFLNIDLWEDLFGQLIYLLLVALASFSTDIIIRKFKTRKMQKLYGLSLQKIPLSWKSPMMDLSSMKVIYLLIVKD